MWAIWQGNHCKLNCSLTLKNLENVLRVRDLISLVGADSICLILQSIDDRPTIIGFLPGTIAVSEIEHKSSPVYSFTCNHIHNIYTTHCTRKIYEIINE